MKILLNNVKPYNYSFKRESKILDKSSLKKTKTPTEARQTKNIPLITLSSLIAISPHTNVDAKNIALINKDDFKTELQQPTQTDYNHKTDKAALEHTKLTQAELNVIKKYMCAYANKYPCWCQDASNYNYEGFQTSFWGNEYFSIKNNTNEIDFEFEPKTNSFVYDPFLFSGTCKLKVLRQSNGDFTVHSNINGKIISNTKFDKNGNVIHGNDIPNNLMQGYFMNKNYNETEFKCIKNILLDAFNKAYYDKTPIYLDRATDACLVFTNGKDWNCRVAYHPHFKKLIYNIDEFLVRNEIGISREEKYFKITHKSPELGFHDEFYFLNDGTPIPMMTEKEMEAAETKIIEKQNINLLKGENTNLINKYLKNLNIRKIEQENNNPNILYADGDNFTYRLNLQRLDGDNNVIVGIANRVSDSGESDIYLMKLYKLSTQSSDKLIITKIKVVQDGLEDNSPTRKKDIETTTKTGANKSTTRNNVDITARTPWLRNLLSTNNKQFYEGDVNQTTTEEIDEIITTSNADGKTVKIISIDKATGKATVRGK